MCFDFSIFLKKTRHYIKPLELETEEEELLSDTLNKAIEETQSANSYHISGFSHRYVPAFHKNKNKLIEAIPLQWGLVPFWIKNKEDADNIASKTLNARSETMLQKPSYRRAAAKKRVIIPMDSFYEYHHYPNKKVEPFRVMPKSDEPLYAAGIADRWVDKETGEEILSFSLVTTEALGSMALLHNNPKLKEPRCPIFFTPMEALKWSDELDKNEIMDLCTPRNHEFEYYPIQKLRGKNYPGNTEELLKPVEAPPIEGVWEG
ncbi:MAG: SOS response-associated peptidase [Candidatus Kapaibacteriales bacterium]